MADEKGVSGCNLLIYNELKGYIIILDPPPHPVTVVITEGLEGFPTPNVKILVFVTVTGLGMKPSRIEKLGRAKPFIVC